MCIKMCRTGAKQWVLKFGIRLYRYVSLYHKQRQNFGNKKKFLKVSSKTGNTVENATMGPSG